MFHLFKHLYLPQNKLPLLGRWAFHNHSKTILKIKYANEDNCGISGNKKIQTYYISDQHYIYMMGYESIRRFNH